MAGLGAAGLAIAVLGVFEFTLNTGSCPAIPVGSGEPGCDHTFPGTDISISRTGSELVLSGLALLLAAGFVAVYAWFFEKPRKQQ